MLQEPIPLPSDDIQEVSGTVGSLRILDGRVDVEYGLYEYGSERDEVVHITLDITLDQEDDLQQNMYVGFGFAADTMSGLVITCSPILVRTEDLEGGSVMQELTPRCHQWHGSGTNLYPRPPPDTDRGWHVTSVHGNATLVTLTFAGRVADVIRDANESRLSLDTSLRAIASIGQAAPDTGTPLMHASSRDRTPMILERLSAAIAISENAAQSIDGDIEEIGSAEIPPASNALFPYQLGWFSADLACAMLSALFWALH